MRAPRIVCLHGRPCCLLLQSPRPTLAALLAVFLLFACMASNLAADGPFLRKADPYGPQTGAEARESALRAIPRDRMDEESLAKVDAVLADTTIFRRMPIRVVQCDPDLYLFLVRHPDVVVNIWEVLQLSKLDMQQTGQGAFEVADNAGTDGAIQFLYQSADTHVIYSEGKYHGPMVARPLTGRSLMILKTGYVREPDGRYYITSRLDAFLQVDNEGVELVTRTLHPLLGKVADINFTQTIGFVGRLSKTAEVDPDGMVRLANRLNNVAPEVRLQFALLSNNVSLKAAQVEKLSQAEDPEPLR